MNEKTKFLSISPVLASANVASDVEWYENKLGFKNVYDSTHYQDGVMDYAVIGREKLFMHLQFQFPKDMINADIKFQVKNIETKESFDVRFNDLERLRDIFKA